MFEEKNVKEMVEMVWYRSSSHFTHSLSQMSQPQNGSVALNFYNKTTIEQVVQQTSKREVIIKSERTQSAECLKVFRVDIP